MSLRIADLDLPIARQSYLSLVVPTYNERPNIQALVERISQILDPLLDKRYELIVVDDDSPDRTWELAESLRPDYPQLRVVRRQQERGLATAVIRGWQEAQGQILGVIDSDLQHPPEMLFKMLTAMEEGADLVVGSRNVEGGGVSDWGFIRRFLSRGAQLLGLIILPSVIGRVSDPMSGYFMVRRNAIAEQDLNPIGYKILIEVLGRGDIGKITELGYVFQERQDGASKVTWKQYIEYITHLLRLRFRGRIGQFSQRFKIPFKRFMQFGLVGLSGVFVDMTILYLLHDPQALGLPLTRSKIIAAEIAIANNFLWNDRWTFGDISSQQSGWQKRIKRFIKFNLVCLIGLGLNVLILNILVNYAWVKDYRIANLLAIVIVTIWNFWINLKLSWRVTQTKP
jgi:dolichol-phosphate mannosyltransferase